MDSNPTVPSRSSAVWFNSWVPRCSVHQDKLFRIPVVLSFLPTLCPLIQRRIQEQIEPIIRSSTRGPIPQTRSSKGKNMFSKAFPNSTIVHYKSYVQSTNGTTVHRRSSSCFRYHNQAVANAEKWCQVQASKMPEGSRKFVGFEISPAKTTAEYGCFSFWRRKKSRTASDLAQDGASGRMLHPSETREQGGEVLWWEC